MKHKNALPDKLSELLEVAINDLLSLDREKYTPTWDHWHTPPIDPDKGKCAVCLAGAVIANLDDTSPTSYIDVTEDVTFADNHLIDDADLLRKLLALDELRSGSIARACDTMEIELSLEQTARIQCTYHTYYNNMGASFLDWPSAETHIEKLRIMVAELKEMGL